MFKKFKGFFAVLFAVAVGVLVTSPAHADLDLSAITIDTAPIFTLAGIIIAAIASIWAIKKVIKLGNHS